MFYMEHRSTIYRLHSFSFYRYLRVHVVLRQHFSSSPPPSHTDLHSTLACALPVLPSLCCVVVAVVFIMFIFSLFSIWNIAFLWEFAIYRVFCLATRRGHINVAACRLCGHLSVCLVAFASPSLSLSRTECIILSIRRASISSWAWHWLSASTAHSDPFVWVSGYGSTTASACTLHTLNLMYLNVTLPYFAYFLSSISFHTLRLRDILSRLDSFRRRYCRHRPLPYGHSAHTRRERSQRDELVYTNKSTPKHTIWPLIARKW